MVNGATRPPRGARLRRRFWTALDYLTAVFFAVLIFGVLAFQHSSGPREVMSPRYVLLALLALALSVPVAIRRRVPVRSLLIVLAGCLITLIIGGSITRGPFLPLAVVLYLVASACRRSIALAGLAGALGLLIAQGVVLHFDGLGSGNATAAGLVLTIFWMVGYLVQQRRTYVAHLRERAATDAVTRERLRIARELHDVVAHSMTVVTVQAGFGEYVFDSQPAEARAALSAIQAVSREALGEMQRMLCVLRRTDGDIAAADAELSGPRAGRVRPARGGHRRRAGPGRNEPGRGPPRPDWPGRNWPGRTGRTVPAPPPGPPRTGRSPPRTGSGRHGSGPPPRSRPPRGWPTWAGWWSGPRGPGSR